MAILPESTNIHKTGQFLNNFHLSPRRTENIFLLHLPFVVSSLLKLTLEQTYNQSIGSCFYIVTASIVSITTITCVGGSF